MININLNLIPEVDRRNLTLIYEEYLAAKKKHPRFTTPHQGYSVLLEELEELWDIIKGTELTHHNENRETMKYEVKAVGAMALRFMIDL